MQTITNLRELTPSEQVTALCAMENGELDRIAAEVQGWEKDRVEFDHRKFRDCWIYDQEPSGFGKYVEVRRYRPSRKDGQALDLARRLTRDSAYHLNICIHSFACFNVELEYEFVDQMTLQHEKPSFMLDETDTKHLARAVTILAIAGLLGGE